MRFFYPTGSKIRRFPASDGVGLSSDYIDIISLPRHNKEISAAYLVCKARERPIKIVRLKRSCYKKKVKKKTKRNGLVNWEGNVTKV